jgi:hypothetical protein
VAAAVDRQALSDRLKEAGLKVKDSARGAGGELPPAEEIRAHAAEVLRDVLDDLPRTLAAGVRVGSPLNDPPVNLEIRVWVDPTAYGLACRRLRQALDVIKLDKNTLTVESSPAGPGAFRSGDGAFQPKPLTEESRGWDLLLLTDVDGSGARTQWEHYLVGTDRERTLSGLRGRLGVLVSALGADGGLVGARVVPMVFDESSPQPSFRYGWAETIDSVGRPKFLVAPVGLDTRPFRKGAALLYRVQETKPFAWEKMGNAPLAGFNATVVLVP